MEKFVSDDFYSFIKQDVGEEGGNIETSHNKIIDVEILQKQIMQK